MENNLVLISVIVPIYKVEPYLDRCVASIVNQTYTNLEIILVDDGSPDNCGAMCDAWARKDGRIKVIHQQNSGGGAARNIALDVSAGELIAFVDSDDYLAEDMFEHLYTLMEAGADIAECAYVNTYDDSANFCRGAFRTYEYTAQEAMAEHIRDRYFRQLIWNKLYRREVIGDIRFPVGTQIDDEFFTYQVLGNARKLIRSDRVCYAYRQQDASVMHSMSPAKRVQAVEAKALRQQYMDISFPELTDENLKNLWFTCVYTMQILIKFCSPEEQAEGKAIVMDILRRYPIQLSRAKGLAMKQFIWLTMAKISFDLTCKIRARLGVGF